MSSGADSGRRPKVVIYATGWCGYCERARQIFRRKGVEFDEVDIESGAAARREMLERSGRRSVPQVFIGERHIGGSDDLLALEASGELDALLGVDRPQN
jgi:glutaredoxin 3